MKYDLNHQDGAGEYEMNIDLKLLTECALRMLAGLQAYPLGGAMLVCLLLAMAVVGMAWK